jgi:proline utilization trans-activator
MLLLIGQHGDVPQLEGQENNNIPVLEEQGISPNQLLNVASMLDGHQHLNVDLGDVSSWLWEAADFEGLPSL